MMNRQLDRLESILHEQFIALEQGRLEDLIALEADKTELIEVWSALEISLENQRRLELITELQSKLEGLCHEVKVQLHQERMKARSRDQATQAYIDTAKKG